MSGIDRQTRNAPVTPKPTTKTTKPEVSKQPTKKEAEAAKKKENLAAVERRKDGFDPGKNMPVLTKNYSGEQSKEIGSLTGGKGDSSVNKDSSVTTTRTSKTKDGEKTDTLTTGSSLGTKQIKFESETKNANGNSSKESFEAKRDSFGRTTSAQSQETKVKLGNVTVGESTKTNTDMLGGNTVTNGRSVATTSGNNTTTVSRNTSEGPLNTSSTTLEKKVETKNSEKSTTTVTREQTTGSSTTVAGTTETKDGKFTVNNTIDRTATRSTKVSKDREITLKDPLKDNGLGGPDRLNKAQKTADILANSGLKNTVQGEKWDTAKLDELKQDNVTFTGAKYGTQGDSSYSAGADGVDAKWSRGASAGLYAQKNGKVENDNGSASYKLGARLDARANIDTSIKANSNGVEAKFNAKATATAEVSANGRLESKPIKFAGVDTTASIDATVRLKAELSAEANVDVKLQRNPPVVVIDGKVGASAVVKAEAEVTVGAGPFSVTATGYGSAGAEAQANGTFKYENGKIKFGFGAGAAVKVGVGGGIKGEVDLKQLGEMATNTVTAAGTKAKQLADADGDGKLGMNDVKVRAQQVTRKVAKTFEPVRQAAVKTANTVYRGTTRAINATTQAVRKTVNTVTNTVRSAVDTTTRVVTQAAQTVRDTVSSAASTAVNYVSSGASYVRSLLPW